MCIRDSYTPQVDIEEVVLADAKKTLVLDTVKHFDTFTQASRNLDLHKKLSYGRGMVLLFYGPSGTGKTMMANALAALIGKKVRARGRRARACPEGCPGVPARPTATAACARLADRRAFASALSSRHPRC